MSAHHTPGPWFNTSQDDSPMGEVMDQPLDSGVTLHVSVSGPNAKADARLIAAAPDLLAAAAAASLCILDTPRTPARAKVVQMLCDAIDKTNGGEA